MEEKVAQVLKKIEAMDKTWSKPAPSKSNPEHVMKLWCVPRSTGELLRFLVVASKSKQVLELGCSAGYSAIWLALGAKETGGHVTTTEMYQTKIDLAKQHFFEAGLDNTITLLEQDIDELLKGWNKEIDFVFMDAGKEEYLEYYEQLLPHLSSGGVLVADNVLSHKHKTSGFNQRVLQDERVVATLLEIDNGLMLAVKK